MLRKYGGFDEQERMLNRAMLHILALALPLFTDWCDGSNTTGSLGGSTAADDACLRERTASAFIDFVCAFPPPFLNCLYYTVPINSISYGVVSVFFFLFVHPCFFSFQQKSYYHIISNRVILCVCERVCSSH